MKNIPNQTNGFTLVEMMIVVVIIGILAAIGVPAYQNHLEKGQLADAKRALTNLRQSFETARLERPRAFVKANDFKNEFQRAYRGSIENTDVEKAYQFVTVYLPDANRPQSFSVTATPKKAGRKYGLKLEMSGEVKRCKATGGQLSACENF